MAARLKKVRTTAVEAIFEPEIIYRDQLTPQHSPWSAERRLMLAVLEEAVATFFRNLRAVSGTANRAKYDVERWIESNDRVAVFSFANVCEACGFDPDYLRQGIHDAKHRGTVVTAGGLRRSDEARRTQPSVRSLARARRIE